MRHGSSDADDPEADAGTSGRAAARHPACRKADRRKRCRKWRRRRTSEQLARAVRAASSGDGSPGRASYRMSEAPGRARARQALQRHDGTCSRKATKSSPKASRRSRRGMDLALIGAGQKVEHYEIASYKTARNLAQQLNETAGRSPAAAVAVGRGERRSAAQPACTAVDVVGENAGGHHLMKRPGSRPALFLSILAGRIFLTFREAAVAGLGGRVRCRT